MLDMAGGNPFADLMSKAVKLKGAQQAQLRTTYDSWPQYFQHSLFMQESVISARQLPFAERIATAENMKTSGNTHFAAGELEEAVAEYEKALAVFKFILNKDPGWKKKGIEDTDLRVVDYSCQQNEKLHEDVRRDQKRLDALKLSCYLNIAVAKFKLREFLVCIRACDDALELDSHCVKALYRRAQALITPPSSGALEFDRAIADLQRAYDIDPRNRDISKLLRDLKQQRVRQRILDKKTFSGMFGRGQVYDNDGNSTSKSDSQVDFEREVNDAERLAHMLERKGQEQHAKEIRDRVAKAKEVHARQEKRVDFFHPTPEMIRDAKENGIDLTDRNVQQMLHDMQEEERNRPQGAAVGPTPSSPTFQASRRTVDEILKSMSNAEIAEMLRAEGVDYHKIGDREQFFETARQVLMSKLGEIDRGTKKSELSTKPSTTRTIMMLAGFWTLMRLYSTGGLSFIGRLVMSMWTEMTGGEANVVGERSNLFG